MNSSPLFAYFGHHKCGSTWLCSIMHEICQRINLNYAYVHSPYMFHGRLNSFVQENQTEFLAYTNAKIRYIEELDHFQGFHVIRDPRDILISAYFSHLYSHPTDDWSALKEHRQQLQKVSKDEGLLLEMQFCRDVFTDLYTWNYTQPNVIEMKMEEFAYDPYESLIRAFSFLGLLDERYGVKVFLCRAIRHKIYRTFKHFMPFHWNPGKISIHDLLAIVYRNRFSAKTGGRKQGEENVKSHYRKGTPGDWMNHFTPDHHEYFKKEYNDVLLKLGYETTPDW